MRKTVKTSLLILGLFFSLVATCSAKQPVQLHVLQSGSKELQIAFSPDGKTLAVCGKNGMLQLWNVASGTKSREVAIGGDAWDVRFGANGKTLVAALAIKKDGGADEDVFVSTWDVATLKKRATFQLQGTDFFWLALSDDGRFVTTCADDYSDTNGRRLTVWDVNRRTSMRVYIVGDDSYTLKFSPSGTFVLAGNGLNKVLLWNWRANTFAKVEIDELYTTMSPDGKTLAGAFLNEGFRLRDTASGRVLHTISEYQGGDGVFSLTFSPDSKTLATGGSEGDSRVRIWNAKNGKLLSTLQGHTKGITEIAFSPDGNTLASGSDDGTVRLWRVQ